MKPGKYAMRITMLVLFLGILAYFGIYIYQSVNNTAELTTVYTATEETTAEVSGFVVRDEYVINEATSSMLEVVLSEGEKVSVGGEVAKIYSTEAAVERQQQIKMLEEELAQLQTLTSGSSSSDAVALEQELEALLLKMHHDLSSSDFSDLTSSAEKLETLALQQGYLSDDSFNLESTLTSLANQIATLESSASSDTRTVTASVAGTFSSVVDGYEDLLTVDMLQDLTVETLSSWKNLASTVTSDQYAGKLIAGHSWYYAALMDVEEASLLSSGSVTMRFTTEFTEAIDMKVESISEEVDGKVAVVFSSIDYITETAGMRYQAADIVYNTTTGIEIPLTALRIQNIENADGTNTSEMGVYVLVGTRVEWKPVKVLYMGENTCLVEPTVPTDSDALRSGDTVVSGGKNIYSGKVITE